MPHKMIQRRSLLTGLVSLIAAPAIVRVQNIMPIKAYRIWSWWQHDGDSWHHYWREGKSGPLYLDGHVAEVAIWDRVLNPDELWAIASGKRVVSVAEGLQYYLPLAISFHAPEAK
jgi:hypothetical protein